MITGIIFACLVEEAVCKPLSKEFDTVQECIVDTTEVIKSLGDTPGIVLYSVCSPESQPL